MNPSPIQINCFVRIWMFFKNPNVFELIRVVLYVFCTCFGSIISVDMLTRSLCKYTSVNVLCTLHIQCFDKIIRPHKPALNCTGNWTLRNALLSSRSTFSLAFLVEYMNIWLCSWLNKLKFVLDFGPQYIMHSFFLSCSCCLKKS